MEQCPGGKLYIGETLESLKERITDHRSSIKRNNIINSNQLLRHFVEIHHIFSWYFLGIQLIMPSQRHVNVNLLKKFTCSKYQFKPELPLTLNINNSLVEHV